MDHELGRNRDSPELEGARGPLAAPASARPTVGSRNMTLWTENTETKSSLPLKFCIKGKAPQ